MIRGPTAVPEAAQASAQRLHETQTADLSQHWH